MPTHTINLPPGSSARFRELFNSKDDVAQHKQQEKEEKKRKWLLLGSALPAIKDPEFATHLDHALASRRVAVVEASTFRGTYTITKQGVIVAELIARIPHPGFFARFVIGLFADEIFNMFFRIECTETPKGTVITCRRFAASLDKLGCIFTLLFGAFTFIIGGILFYRSYRKGPKLAEAINDAVAEALTQRLSLQT
jgi:hypothetical protein